MRTHRTAIIIAVALLLLAACSHVISINLNINKMRKHKIKLSIKSDKDLEKITSCNICTNKVPYGKLYFYVDESNIAITNNAKGICKQCYETNLKKLK